MRRSASAYTSRKRCGTNPGPPQALGCRVGAGLEPAPTRPAEVCKVPGLPRIVTSAAHVVDSRHTGPRAAHAAVSPGHGAARRAYTEFIPILTARLGRTGVFAG